MNFFLISLICQENTKKSQKQLQKQLQKRDSSPKRLIKMDNKCVHKNIKTKCIQCKKQNDICRHRMLYKNCIVCSPGLICMHNKSVCETCEKK